MKIERREFLKLAGLSAIFGLGGTAIAGGAKQIAEYKNDPKELKGKRWGLVIDMDKFASDADVQKMSEICHTIHNVPTIANPMPESMDLDGADSELLPERDTFLAEHYHHKPVLRCATLRESYLCQGVAQQRRPSSVPRDRQEGYASPVTAAALHGWLPYGARSLNWIVRVLSRSERSIRSFRRAGKATPTWSKSARSL
jgi:molybdopterin-containing oxidoreductase family iron-sulfur binding subunit